MALKDITGQKQALRVLRGVMKKRIPHTLLFSGDEGIGKYLTALNFAKALNCLGGEHRTLFQDDTSETGKEIDACDSCSSCSKVDRVIHPDVRVINPGGEGGQITVSAVRELEESLSFKPFEGKWKIAIVDQAEKLNQSAANAFLRTLEEPTDQSIIIIITSRPDMLIPTIRSRCQQVNFAPLPIDVMASLIGDAYNNLSPSQLRLVSALSGGRPGYALRENLIDRRDWSISICRQLLESFEGSLWKNRDEAEEWFEWSELWLRDAAVFKATGRTDLLINQDKKQDIEAFTQGAKTEDILKLAREFYNIRRRLHLNLNRQVTLNYLSLLMKRRLGMSNR